jgi:hypothetical protein
MARRYSKRAGKKVERAMHEMKRGELKSGRSGQKVKSRKQAIAIGLSEARAEGDKVPSGPSGRKKGGRNKGGRKQGGRKKATRKRKSSGRRKRKKAS